MGILTQVLKCHKPFKVIEDAWLIATVFVLSLWAQTTLAEDATLDGNIIHIPLVVVDELGYSIDLALTPNTDPPELDLVGAVAVTFTDTTGATTFADGILSIPFISVGDIDYWVDLLLISGDPVRFRLNDAGIVTPPLFSEESIELFETAIYTPIVQNRCVICHREGGLSGHTRLVFHQGNDEVESNMLVLKDFIETIDGGGDLLLDKARGVSHGGGVQLSGDSAEFGSFNAFLTSLGFENDNFSVSTSTFFDAVSLLSMEETLRKAAELLQGRPPTEAELNQLDGGDEGSLRAVLIDLMQGEKFKDFLRVNANDVMLTEGAEDITGGVAPNMFIDGNAFLDRYYEETGDSSGPGFSRVDGQFIESLKRQPIELIVHVIVNDIPYTEVLTADYMMVNPVLDITFKSGVQFDDSNNFEEWRPGTINNYPLVNDNRVWGPSTTPYWTDDVLVGGDILDYPHAGVLNTLAFMTRYPSTATNRNRARARWTYLFFLGVDIEASAARTTDPAALADKNNPTMNNPNCTVCHEVMDPVAGTFQNYGHLYGWYRQNGQDSLDGSYKYPDDGAVSPYQEGDLWYRDMREPGFNGNSAVGQEHTLPWLAQQIVADPRFAKAAVKFWWPAVYGTDPLLAPEVPTDYDFQEQLAAFEVENALMDELAEGFLAGFSDYGPYNLKDLLVEMILSPRFRARNLIGISEADRGAYAGIGPGRILTPEMLQEKIESLLGFEWLHSWSPVDSTKNPFLLATERYYMIYGGIDSFGVTDRPPDYSTVMRAVIERLANDGSAYVLGKDFLKPREERLLFPYVEVDTRPDNQQGLDQISENIRFLVNQLWSKDWGNDHEQVIAAIDLWLELFERASVYREENPDTYSEVNGGWFNPNYGPEFSWDEFLASNSEERHRMERLDHWDVRMAWRGLMSYLISDFEFIYQ